MKTLNEYIQSSPEEFRQEELILEVTELIAHVMKETGISRSELASHLGKSKAHVSQCLSGEQNLTLRTVSDILGALGYRMQVGAVPLNAEVAKPIPRLYPIGGWSFEKHHFSRQGEKVACLSAGSSTCKSYAETDEVAA